MVESFLALLEGRPAARTVWVADLDYWIAGQEEKHRADPAWRTEEGFLDLCAAQRVMAYYYYGKFWLAEPRYDATVKVRTERVGRVTRTVWKTRAEKSGKKQTYEPLSCSTAHSRFAIQSVDDLRVMLDLMEHRTLEPTSIDDYHARLQRWRKREGCPASRFLAAPFPRSCMNGRAHARIYLLADHPELVQRLFAVMGAQEQPVLEAVARVAPPLVHFADNLSADTLCGYYEAYLEPVHRHRLEVLHRAGTRCVVSPGRRGQGHAPEGCDSRLRCRGSPHPAARR